MAGIGPARRERDLEREMAIPEERPKSRPDGRDLKSPSPMVQDGSSSKFRSGLVEHREHPAFEVAIALTDCGYFSCSS
jgi:hypothetical protein